MLRQGVWELVRKGHHKTNSVLLVAIFSKKRPARRHNEWRCFLIYPPEYIERIFAYNATINVEGFW